MLDVQGMVRFGSVVVQTRGALMIILGMFGCVMLVAGVYYLLTSGILWFFLPSFVFEFSSFGLQLVLSTFVP